MVAGDSPKGLPDGWSLQFNVLKTGREVKYYVNSVTGQKFFSKDDLMYHIKARNLQLHQPQPTKSPIKRPSKNNQMQLMQCMNDDPEWLPHGWIVGLKTRKSGSLNGKLYKCYVDPSTGYKFYSKPEVFRYLQTVEQKSSISKRKEILTTVVPTSKPSSAKRQKLDHPVTRSLHFGGNGSTDVGSMASLGAYSLRKREGKTTVSTLTTLPVATATEITQKSSRDDGSESKENSNANWPAPRKAEDSESNQDRKVSADGGPDILFPEVDDRKVQISLMSEIKRDESYRRKTQTNLSKSNDKNGLNLPCRFSKRLAGIEPDMVINSVSTVQLSSEADKKQGQNAESGIKGVGSRTKTQNSLSESNNKKRLNLPHQSLQLCAGFEAEPVTNPIFMQALPKIIRPAKGEAVLAVDLNKGEVALAVGLNKGEAALAVGFNKGILADEASEKTQSETRNELPVHTSCDANNSLLKEPPNLPHQSLDRVSGTEPEPVTNTVIIVQALPKTLRTGKGEVALPVDLNNGVLADEASEQTQLKPRNEHLLHTSRGFNNPLLGEPQNESQRSDTITHMLKKAEASGRSQAKMVSADDGPALTPEVDIKQEQNYLESGKKKEGQGKNDNNLRASSKKKGLNLPRRSSKRLAGFGPEQVVNSVSSAQALQRSEISCENESILAVGLIPHAFADGESKRIQAETRSELPHLALSNINDALHGKLSNKNQNFLCVSAGSKDKLKNLEVGKTNDEKSESELIPPFGKFLSDPCLEFAFKTLTGELPVEITPDNGLVSTPPADVRGKRDLTMKKIDKRSDGKSVISSRKLKTSKKLSLPHQASDFHPEPVARSIPNDFAFKNSARVSSKTGAVLDTGLARNRFPDAPEAECTHYHSVNVKTMPQNEPSSNRTWHLDNCTASEEHLGVLEVEKNGDKPELSPFFSFSDYWTDPCFEFAFKTLTGAIPVEDSLQNQSYFQQQVDASQTQQDSYVRQQSDISQTLRDVSSALPDFGLPSFFQTDISVHFDSPEKQLASQPQIPVNNHSFPSTGSLSLASCSSISSQQPPRGKEGLRGKVNS